MAEGGLDSREYRDFISAKSNNMDDSGFFSIQVMSSALKAVWQLDMIPFNRKDCPVAEAARRDPTLV